MDRKAHIGVDPEDWHVALLKVERSFGVKFKENELAHVRTLAELLDAIDGKIPGYDVKDCATQQAFYRIRAALVTELDTGPSAIGPDSGLDALVPRKGRHRSMKRIESHVGVPLNALSVKRWMAILLALVFCGSLVTFIWSSQFGIVGLVVFAVLLALASVTKKEFNVRTVGALSERASQYDYRSMRRDYGAVNRKEIRAKLKQFFQEKFALEPDDLREDMLIAS
ncbi:MAG: hypothetical protein ABI432_11155 [Flavobacteriales bacterium]